MSGVGRLANGALVGLGALVIAAGCMESRARPRAVLSVVPTPVEGLSDTAADPDVTVDGSGRIHIVWQRTTSGGATDILHVRSTDGGRTWSSIPIALDSSANAVSRPRVAARGSSVVVVWQEWTGSQDDVYAAESSDGGSTWTAATALAANVRTTPAPDVALDGNGTVVVVHRAVTGQWLYANCISGSWGPAYGIVAISRPSGGSFGSPVTLSGGPFVGSPAVAADANGGAVAAWVEYPTGYLLPPWTGWDVFASRSGDGGATWSARANATLVSGQGVRCEDPDVALSGTSALLVFSTSQVLNGNWSPTSWSVSAVPSSDGGKTWGSAATTTTSAAAAPLSPCVAAEGGSTFSVAWSEPGLVSGTEVLRSRTTDGGATFATPANISANAGFSVVPRIAPFSGGTILVWADDSASAGIYDVLSY